MLVVQQHVHTIGNQHTTTPTKMTTLRRNTVLLHPRTPKHSLITCLWQRAEATRTWGFFLASHLSSKFASRMRCWQNENLVAPKKWKEFFWSFWTKRVPISISQRIILVKDPNRPSKTARRFHFFNICDSSLGFRQKNTLMLWKKQQPPLWREKPTKEASFRSLSPWRHRAYWRKL